MAAHKDEDQAMYTVIDSEYVNLEDSKTTSARLAHIERSKYVSATNNESGGKEEIPWFKERLIELVFTVTAGLIVGGLLTYFNWQS